MIDPSKLKVSDRVRFVTGSPGTQWRAIVDQVTDNYISLNWGLRGPFTQRCDILLKASPLWQFLELIE